MIKDLRLLMVGPIASVGGVATHTIALFGALRDSGVPVILYNSDYDSQGLKIWTNFIKIHSRTLGMFYFCFFNKSMYKIIHVQSSGGIAGFLNAITGTIVAFILKRPLVVSFHHGNKEFIYKYKFILNFVIKNTDRFVLVSNYQKSVLREAGLATDRVTVIPNGYNSSVFKPIDRTDSRRRLNIPASANVLLNVANLVKIKGQKYLIESMDLIIRSNPNTLLYIVGDGPLRDELQYSISKYNLKGHVFLVGGNKPAEEIQQWMNACDVFVLPSISESFGIAQIEAMACGKPVVATRNGGSEEVITNDKLGILVEPRDAECLAHAIIKALGARWDIEYIREYVQQFAWESVSMRTIEVYEQLDIYSKTI